MRFHVKLEKATFSQEFYTFFQQPFNTLPHKNMKFKIMQ
jgi:hypothetical protein